MIEPDQYEADCAWSTYDAVVALTALTALLAFIAKDAVAAYEAELAFNALLAQLAVPCSDPVNERATILPLTSKLPVIWCRLFGFNWNFLFILLSNPPAKNWTGEFEALPICKSLPVEYRYASFASPTSPVNPSLLIPISI